MPNIVKNTTFPGLLDLVAPHSCRGCKALGSPLCDCCKNYIISHRQNLCPKCKRLKTGPTCPDCPELPPIFVAGFRDGPLGELIRDYKYNSVRALARPLAEIMHSALIANAKSPEDLEDLIIVPLPTIGRHVRARGFDHTLLLAKNLARLLPSARVRPLLIRAKNTVQVGANASARKKQAKSAYALAPGRRIDPAARYLLLDDVWTTGASMLAACEKLRLEAGAEDISLAVLAINSLD